MKKHQDSQMSKGPKGPVNISESALFKLKKFINIAVKSEPQIPSKQEDHGFADFRRKASNSTPVSIAIMAFVALPLFSIMGCASRSTVTPTSRKSALVTGRVTSFVTAPLSLGSDPNESRSVDATRAERIASENPQRTQRRNHIQSGGPPRHGLRNSIRDPLLLRSPALHKEIQRELKELGDLSAARLALSEISGDDRFLGPLTRSRLEEIIASQLRSRRLNLIHSQKLARESLDSTRKSSSTEAPIAPNSGGESRQIAHSGTAVASVVASAVASGVATGVVTGVAAGAATAGSASIAASVATSTATSETTPDTASRTASGTASGTAPVGNSGTSIASPEVRSVSTSSAPSSILQASKEDSAGLLRPAEPLISPPEKKNEISLSFQSASARTQSETSEKAAPNPPTSTSKVGSAVAALVTNPATIATEAGSGAEAGAGANASIAAIAAHPADAATDVDAKAQLTVLETPPLELKRLSALDHSAITLSSSNDTPLIFDIPVTYNSRVSKWIRYFQTTGRRSFQKHLERSSSYIPMLLYELNKAGLPQDLVYVAMIESGFKPDAVSHMGAMGLWQFMKPTARRYGMQIDWWIDERRDFQKATRAAINYMTDLHRQFNSWYLVAASYNMGENGVARLIKRHGTNNFWELAELGALPRETTDYVPKIIAAMLISKAPALYGFRHLNYHMPISFERTAVPGGTDLVNLAGYLGVSEKYLKDLNPELIKGFIPRDVRSHNIRVPKGSLLTVAQYVRLVASAD